MPVPTPGREAVKKLLAGIMRASLAATRSLEPCVDGADTVKAERMNMICAELLWFHIWRACKRAHTKLAPADYPDFSAYAVKGLAVMAAGCFTGLYDKQAQADFLEGLQAAFDRFEKCGPEEPNPMASRGPIGTTARRIARLAGHGGAIEIVTRALVACMESFNASRVEDAVDTVVRLWNAPPSSPA